MNFWNSLPLFRLIIALQFVHWRDLSWHLNNRQLVFYSIDKHTSLGFVYGKEGAFFMDRSLKNDFKKQAYFMNNHWAFLGLDKKNILDLDSNYQSHNYWKNNHHIQLANQRVLIVDESFSLLDTKEDILIDYCLLSSYFPIRKLLESYHPKLVVIGANLSQYHINTLEKQLNQLELSWHNLKRDGALIVNLRD